MATLRAILIWDCLTPFGLSFDWDVNFPQISHHNDANFFSGHSNRYLILMITGILIKTTIKWWFFKSVD